jgi:hypothetical protein
MTDSEITVSVLREIRDAVIATNTSLSARIDSLEKNLSARIDETNARLDVTNTRLTVVEHVVRDASEQIVFLGRYTKNAIEDLRERVSRLEAKP